MQHLTMPLVQPATDSGRAFWLASVIRAVAVVRIVEGHYILSSSRMAL